MLNKTAAPVFRFYGDYSTWMEARDNCKNKTGKLAEPYNQQENRAIYEIKRGNGPGWFAPNDLKVTTYSKISTLDIF